MPEEPSRKPNIVWIMADDLSWGDLGCYGQQKIKTPNIDRLAEEGMRFTQCHSGSTVCAPSRSSLMQGLHQGHATVRNNSTPVPEWSKHREGPDDPLYGGCSYRHSLQPGDRTVAQVLKDAGYATGLFGKWGLAVGDQPGQPNIMGFDEFGGYLNQRKAHTYYPEYLWHNRETIHYSQHRGHNHRAPNEYDEQGRIIVNGVASQDDLRYSFDVYGDAALDWIGRNADAPFFAYLAYTPPHGALEVPELGEYTNADFPTITHKIWAAMITRMDENIGRLLDLLKERGVDDNTLIFFTSDNGYSASGYVKDPSLNDFFRHAGPWKGEKGNLYQGGLRVPTLARWPGRIAHESESDLVWAFWDFLPTAAEVAGVAPPAEIDGVSILPTLLGRADEQQQHDYLYWEHRDEQALRLGDWYVHRTHPEQPIELYHALDDPAQANDLATEKPEIASRVEDILREAHTPSLYVRSPGESSESWEERMRAAGVHLPNNVNVW